MDHAEFFKSILEGTLHGAYLLHGVEEYTKNKAREKLIELLPADFRAMNLNEFSVFDPEAIILSCSTYPFFSERRIVMVNALPQGDSVNRMLDYIKSMPDTTLLIFMQRGALDRSPAKKTKPEKKDKAKGTDLIAELEKEDRVVLFDTLPESDLIKWILRECASRNIGITRALAGEIIKRTGMSLSTISNETTKLIEFAGENGSITLASIEACVAPSAEFRVFDMMDSFIQGRAADGFSAFHSIISDKNAAIGMVTYLTRQFKLMYHARVLIDNKVPKFQAIKSLPGHEFAAKKAYEAAKGFSQKQLLSAIKDFSSITTIQFSGGGRAEELLEAYLIKHMVKED